MTPETCHHAPFPPFFSLVPAVGINDMTVNEDVGTVVLTLTRTGDTSANSTVQVITRTVPGQATGK